MPFDIDKARTLGYSDAEVADYAGKQFGVDTAAARKSGMDDATILDHIKADPTYSMSNAELGLAGIGHGMRQLARSSLKLSPVAQLYQKFSGNELLPDNAKEDAPLLNRTEGSIGSALGGALPFMGIPAGGLAKIPAMAMERYAPNVASKVAKSVMVDSSLGGALQGAAQPDENMVSKVLNITSLLSPSKRLASSKPCSGFLSYKVLRACAHTI